MALPRPGVTTPRTSQSCPGVLRPCLASPLTTYVKMYPYFCLLGTETLLLSLCFLQFLSVLKKESTPKCQK